jgi:hypothetical protein
LPAALKVLLDILDGQKSATLPGEDVDKKPPLRMKKGIRVACVIGFVYVLGYFTPSITTGLLKPIVWLEMPSTSVTSPADVVLRWKRLERGQWPAVFVYAVSDRKYYPSVCGVGSKSGAERCRVDVGISGDQGKTFELLPALLTPVGEAVIKKYREDPTAAGLAELPEGTLLFRGTTVARKD